MAKNDEIIGTVRGDATSLHGMTTGDIGILDAVDLPMIVIGRDCKIARLNRAATTVLGLKTSDIGRSPGQILAAMENLDRRCAQVIADGAPYRCETRDRDRSFLLRIAPYTESGQQIVGAVLTFTNVTAFRASIDQAIYEREYTKAILNTVIDPLVVLDAELRVQTANRAFYAMFGVSRDETQGIAIRKLGNNGWETSEVWKSIDSTLSKQSEFQAVEIDREFPGIGRRTVVLDARRLGREGDALILLAFQDITERKQAERAVAEQARLIDLSFDAIFVRDGADRITYWNKGASQLYGYSCEEALGRVPHELLRTEFPEPLGRIFEQLHQDHRWTGELIHKRKDGTSVVVASRWALDRSNRGNQNIILEINSDITRQKRSEKELRESEERFRAIVETTPECVKVVDADGTLLHMNSSGLAMIGADCPEAVVGKSVYDLIDAKDRDRFRAFNEGICRGQKGSLEFGMVGLEGVVRQMETHAAPLRNPDGTVVQLGVTRDVTERKRADEELRRSEERFRTLADALDMQVQIRTQELERRNLEIRQQAEQLRELSNRLLQTQDEERRRVARELHDGVGQVLAGVNMALAKLDKERYSLSFEARQSLTESTMLIEQASREVRTVSHLLHPPMLDEIGLESALRWYVEGFAKRSKIAVDMQLAPGFSKGLPRDVALSLYRIVQECLTNVHRHSGSKAAFVGIHRSSVEITLRVKDEGAGISPDIQTKIALGEDSGVGLRGMRERIQQLRGRFEIDSDQNGTRIGAVLPVSDWVAPEVNPIPGRAASAL